jgi:hypothetical protein
MKNPDATQGINIRPPLQISKKEKILTNKKVLIFVLLGALAPLLILLSSILYVPINPIGFLISGILINYSDRSVVSLIFCVIVNAVTGSYFFYLLAKKAKKTGWGKVLAVYITIAVLMYASNFVDLDFKYAWGEEKYCNYYPEESAICGYSYTDQIPTYYGIWIKQPKIVYITGLNRGAHKAGD